MPNIPEIPGNMGHGEGGGNLPKLASILKAMKEAIEDLEQRVEELENAGD